MIKIPEELKGFLVVYTTEDFDTFILDAITSEDIISFKQASEGKSERLLESEISAVAYTPQHDENAGVRKVQRTIKIRRLNVRIGENLKLLYDYMCQLCGKAIGEQYGCSHVVEAHHIEYFSKSFNNDDSNQIIVCPNHHSIIHEVNPIFERVNKLFRFAHGYEENVLLNKHL